jgi:hypothetical protein
MGRVERVNTPAVIAERLRVEGYALMPDFLVDEQVEHLRQQVAGHQGKAGDRGLLDHSWCSDLGDLIRSDPRAYPSLPLDARAVQCALFVKSRAINWLVPLHQDLTVPLAKWVDTPMYSAWSRKEGELFAQAPVELLRELLAVRVHLDDCRESNGALRVVPGTHRGGRLSSAQSRGERAARGERVVAVPRGSLMLMKPLLLHASSKATLDGPRRVLHFLFGPAQLPGGAQWRTRERLPATAALPG